MSATLNAKRFSEYFGGCPTVHIPGELLARVPPHVGLCTVTRRAVPMPGFTHKVTQHFLEDAVELTRWQAPRRTVADLGKPRWGNAKYRFVSACCDSWPARSQHVATMCARSKERMKLKHANPAERSLALRSQLRGYVCEPWLCGHVARTPC